MAVIRVIVADDHRLLRAGIIALLDRVLNVRVVGEACDGEEALALLATTRPDLVLVDIAMPRLDGLSLIERARPLFPETRFIVLSMHADRPYVTHAMKAGAAAYLIKDSETAELELAIKAVARGEMYFSPRISRHLVAAPSGANAAPDAAPRGITARQAQVLRLIALGHTTKSIAHELNISLKTADTHRTQLMERLDIHEIAGLVRYAIREGIVDSSHSP